ncbi:ABC transporter permease [Saccharothrix syringae]|uniref:ABC transporter permease n=1 Tax=Saccharothrix syringae TaxID=103733 RepID=A0A5Q0HDB0_SACSY|nr:ABC transporter permease [Saccharothrix syringae]
MALAGVRRRPGAFAGTLLTAFLAFALLSGGGLLLHSALAASPGPGRFAAADLVVAAPRSVELTTTRDKGDEVKVKTKGERLPGAPTLPAGVLDAVAATPGVAEAVPDAAFPVSLDVAGTPVPGNVVAHGWRSAPLTPHPLHDGVAPGRDDVVVEASLGLPVGGVVRLTSRTGARELRVAGTVAGGVPGQSAVFVADERVADLSGLAGPTAVAVRLAPGADPAGVAAALRGRLDPALTVRAGADKAHADLPGAVPDFTGAVSVFGFVLGITGFAAVFALIGTVSLGIGQRLRELALLRTAGATPGALHRLLLAETTLVALASAAPGLPAGVVVAHVVAGRFRDLGAVPAGFAVAAHPAVLVAATALGLLVCWAATAVAARRAVRIAPTQALREAVTAPTGGRAPRVVPAAVLAGGATAILVLVPLGGDLGMGMGFVSAALLLCAAAALGPVLVGALTAVLSRPVGALGALGRVAGAVTRAESRRVTGVAVPLALVFAVNATVLTNGDLLASVTAAQQADRAAPATVRVAATNAPGLPLATADRVAASAGVTGSALTVGTRVVLDEGGKPEDHPAQGLRLAGEPALDLGVTAGDLAGLAAGGVAVSAPLAAARGWRVGDRPELWLADGTRVALTVVAVFGLWRGFGELVLPADLVSAHDPRGLVGALYLRGAPDLGAWPELAATTAADPRGGAADPRNQQAAWELMVVITLGFTAIAVVNASAMAVGARRREFAGLRLIGATPRQVRALVTREALVTAVVGLVLGCAISGVVVGAFSVALDGRWRLFADPLRYLALVAGVGLLGVVAGWAPARAVIGNRSRAGLNG